VAEDYARTLSEVITGFEGGQQTAALLNQSVMTPLGSASTIPPPPPTPTFVPPPPPVLPNYVQQPAAPPNPAGAVNPSQAFASNQMPGVQMGPPTAGPVPMMATQPPPMMAPPPPPMPMAPQGGMFQQGMMQAQMNQISNPAMAQYMSQQGGMMPDTNMMMGAQYGNMRRDVLMDRRTTVPLGLPGGGQGVPNAFLPMDVFQRTRPSLQFNRAYDSALYEGLETSRLLEQGYNAYAEEVAGLGVSAVAAPVTTAAGATIGGWLAGPGGAITGAEIGLSMAGFAKDIPGVTQATQAIFEPALQRRADAIQGQYASRQFLIGGGTDVDISGTGLSGVAAQRLTRGMDSIADQSGGNLTRKDAINLMQAGGEQGLMDWAQNADQIVETTKTMSKVLGSIAEITGDPDFMNNIKKMGALSRMGIGLADQQQAVRNMDQYARMAGMDIDQLMQNEGLQGAQMFKASGLGAGIGMQTRMFTASQSRQLVAGGAFSEQDLDLYGGTEGVGQTMAELNAAYLSKVSKPLMSYVVGDRNPNTGRFTIDQSRVDKLTSGEIGYEEALRQGANRDMSPTDLADMLSQMKELTTQLGKQMGPEGVQRAALQAAMDLSKQTGGQLSVRAAATSLYDEEVGALVGRMSDRKFQQGVVSQMDAEMRRREFEADKQDRAGVGSAGFLARQGINFEGPTSFLDRKQREVSDFFTQLEEDRRLQAVGVTRFTRGVDVEGFSGVQGLRGDQGTTQEYRSDTVTQIFDNKLVRGSMALGTLGVTEHQRALLGDTAVGQGLRGGLEAAGGAIDRQTAVFGDERAMSRYLRNRGGVIGTIQDMAGQNEDSLLNIMGLAGQGTQSTEDRRRQDDALIRAHKIAFGGDTEALAEGRAELESLLGRDGLVEAGSALGAGQGEEWLESKGLGQSGVKMLFDTNVFDTDDKAMSDERLAEATGKSVREIRNLSPEAKGALIKEATLFMTNEDAQEFETKFRDVTRAGMTERIGQQYLRSGAAAGDRLNEALDTVGLDEYDDLSRGEKEAVTAIAGSGTEGSRKYLAIAALLQKGGSENRQVAERLFKELVKVDDQAHAKFENAKKLVANMKPETRDALIANIEGFVGGGKSMGDMNKMSPEEMLKHMEQTLGQVQTAGEGVKSVERFAATRAALGDVDGSLTEGVEDDEDLMSRVATAEGDTLEQYRSVLGDEAVALAKSGDMSDEALNEFAALTAQETGAGSGSIELSSKKGATNAATQEQAARIQAQRKIFASLNGATRQNTGAIGNLTSAVNTLNSNLSKSGADSMMEKQRGSGGSPRETPKTPRNF